MNRYLLFISFLLYSLGAFSQEMTAIDIVKSYYNALNEGNFSKVQPFVSNTVTIIEGDVVVPYSAKSFYDFFQWDSVFSPSYEIQEISQSENQVIVKLSVVSERLKFLKNSPMSSKMKFTLRNNKIYMMEVVEYFGVDFDVWQYERDTMVKWIDENHSVLSGFINDLTKKGAENYIDAIRLWNLR